MAAASEVGRRGYGRSAPRSAGRAHLPPGPSWPAAAQLAAWIYFSFPFLEGCRRRYGMPFSMRFPQWPSIVVFDDPDANRDIFTGRHEDMKAGQANEPLRPVVGSSSLLLLDGERHLRERKLMLPPFHGARMHRYGEIMREITARDLARWPIGRTFRVQPRTQAITLDIILRAVFGVDEGERLERLRASISGLIHEFSNPTLMMPWFQIDLGPRSPWGRYLRHRAQTDTLLHEQIDARRAEGTQGRDDVLAMLLEARREDGSPLSSADLRDELMTLLAAGHETTATALAWTFHQLAQHPQVQARVHAELDRVVGAGPVDPEGSSALVYLDAVS
jgi:cytochrome P450